MCECDPTILHHQIIYRVKSVRGDHKVLVRRFELMTSWIIKLENYWTNSLICQFHVHTHRIGSYENEESLCSSSTPNVTHSKRMNFSSSRHDISSFHIIVMQDVGDLEGTQSTYFRGLVKFRKPIFRLLCFYSFRLV